MQSLVHCSFLGRHYINRHIKYDRFHTAVPMSVSCTVEVRLHGVLDWHPHPVMPRQLTVARSSRLLSSATSLLHLPGRIFTDAAVLSTNCMWRCCAGPHRPQPHPRSGGDLWAYPESSSGQPGHQKHFQSLSWSWSGDDCRLSVHHQAWCLQVKRCNTLDHSESREHVYDVMAMSDLSVSE